jgi:hypothetical protein
MGPIYSCVVEHRADIGHQVEDVIGVDFAWLVRGAIAPHVRDDHLEAGIGQRRDLVTPQPS